MKRLLIALSLCVLPLVGRAQVNITIDSIGYDRTTNRICVKIVNHTSEWFMLMPIWISDRGKDSYTCIMYQVKDKSGNILYDSLKDSELTPEEAFKLFRDPMTDGPMYCREHFPGQLPLNNENGTQGLAYVGPEWGEYEKLCTYYCQLYPMPKGAHTIETVLHVMIYERSLKQNPQPVYKKDIHKTFQLNE